MTERDDEFVQEADEASTAEPETTPPVPVPVPPAEIPAEQEPADDAAPAPGVTGELPADLKALSESLEQPTGEMQSVEPGDAQDEGSLDDIAPGTVAVADGESAEEPASAKEQLVEAPKRSVSWWPFIAYMVAWLGAAGYTVYQLQLLPAGRAAYETELYSQSLFVGLVSLGAGPVLLLVVWLASWIGRKNVRVGSMFISAFIKGATATLFGALVWLGALLLTDYLRLGRWY